MGCNCSKRIRTRMIKKLKSRYVTTQENVQNESKLSLMKQMWEDAKSNDNDDAKKE